jgi:hypothetical protein
MRGELPSMKRVIPVLLLLLLCGCKAPIHPGTANRFDSTTYDTLLTADSVIQSTKLDLAAGKFPASISGNVKTALNALINAYDIAETFYCGTPNGSSCAANSYHALAMSGTATPQQSSQMQTLSTNVSTATSQLASAKGGS